jgi:sulfur carrier protein ThiS adenylyltransferase
MTGDLFSRNVPGSLEPLSSAVVGIAGCGGLGSNAAVSLARAGVGTLILVDHDRVELSNLNRQCFFAEDIGKDKVDALTARLKTVNPELAVRSHRSELSAANVSVCFAEAQILIEAFDRAESKEWLINAWTRVYPERPLVCGNGLAGLGRTNALRVTRAGNVYFCGDSSSEMSAGLCSARVAIVANMQANVTIELLVHGRTDDND